MIFRDNTRNVAGKTIYYAEYYVQYLIFHYISYFILEIWIIFWTVQGLVDWKILEISLLSYFKDRKVIPRVGRFLPLHSQQWSPSLSQQESRAQSSV